MKQPSSISNNLFERMLRLQVLSNKIGFVKVLVCMLSVSFFPSNAMGQELEVMSFNILYESAPPKNWRKRRPLVVKTIFQENSDILGLQEVEPSQHEDLIKDLAEQYTIYKPLHPKTLFGNSIAYKTSRFTEINRGMFTYSHTPDIQGSDFINNTNSRFATWIILKDNEANKSIFVLSTHFYSPFDQTDERYWSAQLLMGKIKKLAQGLPIIAMGDFNMKETSSAYSVMVKEENLFTDTYRALHSSNPSMEGTSHGDNTTFPGRTNASRIDYIFSAYMNVLESEILYTSFNKVYPSDHYPITTRFTYGTVPPKDSNAVNPGGIYGGKSFCNAFGPQKLNNAQAAFSDCSGTIQYQWQKRKKDICADESLWGSWEDMVGETSESSSSLGDTMDVQFRRGAKTSECGTWQYSNSITMDVVTPLTDPGEISGSIEACGMIDPNELVNVRDASGGCGDGELEYMWQSRDRDACETTWPEWKSYKTLNSKTFDPSKWDRDRQLRRAVKRKGCDWQYSNIVTIEIYKSDSSDPNCDCSVIFSKLMNKN